jgi:outer membrane protein assembly factor BamB
VTAGWSASVDGVADTVAADAHGAIVTVDQRGVVALDDHGRVRWIAPLDGASVGSPVVIGNRVVVPNSRAEGSGGCVGLDRDTGRVMWTYEAIGTGGVAVTRAGPFVLCVMRDGRTAGLGPEFGIAHWEYTDASSTAPSPVEVPDGAVVAVDESSGHFAFVARSGSRWEMTWRDIATGVYRGVLDLGTEEHPSAATVVGPGKFAVATSQPGVLRIVDVRARRLTKIPLPTAWGFDSTSEPLVANGLLVVAARSGEVTAIDLVRRRVRWSVTLPDVFAHTQPVLVAGVVMLTSAAGDLRALRLVSGAPVRLPRDPGWVISMAADAGRGVFIAEREADGGRIERWEPKLGR